MKSHEETAEFVLCVENSDCDDLVLHKVYPVKRDRRAEHEGFCRVTDESGEDYLYPRSYFTSVRLTRRAQEAVLAAG